MKNFLLSQEAFLLVALFLEQTDREKVKDGYPIIEKLVKSTEFYVPDPETDENWKAVYDSLLEKGCIDKEGNVTGYGRKRVSGLQKHGVNFSRLASQRGTVALAMFRDAFESLRDKHVPEGFDLTLKEENRQLLEDITSFLNEIIETKAVTEA